MYFLVLELNCEFVGVKSVVICFKLILLLYVVLLLLLLLLGWLGGGPPVHIWTGTGSTDTIARSLLIARKLPTFFRFIFSASSSSSSFFVFQAQGFLQEK